MIVSHQHRFIFLKTRKTAGTSIEIALSRHCGPRDIITPISVVDEPRRAGGEFRGAQNYVVPWRDYRLKDWARMVKLRKRARLINHVHARSVLRRVGRDVWDSYFKFCVERNPWDRAVSLYFWKTRELDSRPDLQQFLRSTPERLLSNYFIYTLKGAIAVDMVVSFEDLQSGLDAVARRLGLPCLDLPRAKSGHRADQRHYRELMGDTERDIVAAACAREIEAFDYRF